MASHLSRQLRIGSHRGIAQLSRRRPTDQRSYHSYEHEPPPPFDPTQETILAASIPHIREHGFTDFSLSMGARDAGALDVTTNLFPGGAFDLVRYYLVTQRLSLKDRIQFPAASDAGKKPGVGAKVRSLTVERLMANQPIIGRWQEAIALMAQPKNIPTSIAELARLSDEIWFLAGDTSVDGSWYTKRAALSAIYSSTEVFMTQDKSPGFAATEEFLDRRLQDSRAIGGAVSNVGTWLSFTGHAFTNVLRSKGVRI
ncbi:MAG: Ubiquinone biosynthesis protein coq9, mitochondrial [Caeruleum heppii]|nr:MAG: Ubiquinone biosynthesis protein coq9, mitochondrial [Caeruleum heppii]